MKDETGEDGAAKGRREEGEGWDGGGRGDGKEVKEGRERVRGAGWRREEEKKGWVERGRGGEGWRQEGEGTRKRKRDGTGEKEDGGE